MSFRIPVGIYCHNIPTHTPQSGYHGVTEVAKTANIAKMAGKCINCISSLFSDTCKISKIAFFPNPSVAPRMGLDDDSVTIRVLQRPWGPR